VQLAVNLSIPGEPLRETPVPCAAAKMFAGAVAKNESVQFSRNFDAEKETSNFACVVVQHGHLVLQHATPDD
jgi:hypothetical protein